jgi:hypothetical protein
MDWLKIVVLVMPLIANFIEAHALRKKLEEWITTTNGRHTDQVERLDALEKRIKSLESRAV